MSLFKPATHQTAYVKLGVQGFEGSGKTYLANDFAIGISKLIKIPKVAFFDTEKGSDFYVKRYKEVGIQLDVLRSRSFPDLLNAIKEAESGGYAFLIIDSITHVWRELSQGYQKKKNKQRLTMNDWMVLKTEWGQFTDLYVNSKLHIGMCGRAGYEYDFDEDEEGKKEIVKTGTKMKAEGETGFEPDLLIETYKVHLAETLTDRKAKKNAKGFVNRCVVVKDRSDIMNAKVIEKPKFEHFLPIIKTLNLGGEHSGPHSTHTSAELFEHPDRSWSEQQRRREIALEELSAVLIKAALDGTSAEAKKKRVALLEEIFGSSSKTKIEGLSADEIEIGIQSAKHKLGLTNGPVPVGVDPREEMTF